MKVSCLAQSLKNRGADHYMLEGRLLDDRDVADAKEVVRLIAETTGDGHRTDWSTEVRTFVTSTSLVLQVMPIERDRADRRSPVNVFSERPDEWTPVRLGEFFQQLNRFVESIDRHLDPETLKVAKTAIKSSKKKGLTIRRTRTLWTFLVIALLMGAAIWLWRS